MAKQLKDNEIRKTIKVSDAHRYNSVNVRDDENNVIGKIKNGAKVIAIDYDETAQRNAISGKNMDTGKNIKGTVLTRCLA